jgi:hypothetical protein
VEALQAPYTDWHCADPPNIRLHQIYISFLLITIPEYRLMGVNGLKLMTTFLKKLQEAIQHFLRNVITVGSSVDDPVELCARKLDSVSNFSY